MRIYADIRSGKVQDIQKTELDYNNFTAIWDPTTFWIDITDKPEIEVGDLCRLNGSEIIFEKQVPPFSGPVIEHIRSEKLVFLDTAFKSALESSYVESSLGITVNANESSMININALIAMYENSVDTSIKFCDYYNIFHTVSYNDLFVLRREIATNISELYNQKWKYRNAVESVVSEEELNTIEFKFTNKSFL